MDKQFIPYEQALALKELGFNEPCFKQSDHKKKCEHHEQPGGCQLHNLHCGYPNCTIDESVIPVPLPLYQQAFKWLLNKKSLSIRYWGDGSGECSSYNKDIFDFDTELEGLKKLIEIVK